MLNREAEKRVAKPLVAGLTFFGPKRVLESLKIPSTNISLDKPLTVLDPRTSVYSNQDWPKQLVFSFCLRRLQRWISQNEDLTSSCFILFGVPFHILPFLDPSIEWIDARKGEGGQWIRNLIHPEATLISWLKNHQVSSSVDLQPILNLKTWERSEYADVAVDEKLKSVSFSTVPPETGAQYRVGFYEAGFPSDYVPIAVESEVNREFSNAVGRVKFYKYSLTELLKNSLADFLPQKREEALFHYLSFFYGSFPKAKIIGRLNLIHPENSACQFPLHWLNSAEVGPPLFDAYNDYVFNRKRRSWETILKFHNKSKPRRIVIEEDLKLVISYRPPPRGIADHARAWLRFDENLGAEYVSKYGVRELYPSDSHFSVRSDQPPLFENMGEIFGW